MFLWPLLSQVKWQINLITPCSWEPLYVESDNRDVDRNAFDTAQVQWEFCRDQGWLRRLRARQFIHPSDHGTDDQPRGLNRYWGYQWNYSTDILISMLVAESYLEKRDNDHWLRGGRGTSFVLLHKIDLRGLIYFTFVSQLTCRREHVQTKIKQKVKAFRHSMKIDNRAVLSSQGFSPRFSQLPTIWHLHNE